MEMFWRGYFQNVDFYLKNENKNLFSLIRFNRFE